MIAERFPYFQLAYQEAGVEAQFRIYEGVGHTSRPARDDIVEFHRRSIRGEDVSEFGNELGTVAAFDITPDAPVVVKTVEFDGSDSRAGTGELVSYTWHFGDGGTGAGEQVSHTYEEPGEYTVTLAVLDDDRVKTETSVELTVDAAEMNQETDNETDRSTERENTDSTDPDSGDGEQPQEVSEETPGFGIETAITSLCGTAYLLRRRIGLTENE